MRRSIALLLAVLLLALLLGLGWRLRGESATKDSVEEAAAAGAEGAVPAPAPDEAPATAGEAGITRADAPLAGAAPAAAAEPSIRVRVVLDPERRPAAGAEVLLLPLGGSRSLPESERQTYLDANSDEQLDRWGRAFACDAAGVAMVPPPEWERFPVGARLGEAWGRVDADRAEAARAGELLIVLRPALHLRVLVVDEAARPVEGAVVAYQPLRRGRGGDAEEAVTGADGIAHLRHLQAEYERMAGHADRHVVALRLAADPMVQESFDPKQPPREPIVLVMPSTGTVEVELRDPDGALILASRSVALQRLIDDPDNPSPPGVMNHQSWRGLTWSRPAQGVARFERVGLGLTLEYGSDFEGTGKIECRTGAGPTRAGETVRFVLQQSARAPMLIGRIVNEDGSPRALQTLHAALMPATGSQRLAPVRLNTDAAGAFRSPIAVEPGTSGLILAAHEGHHGTIRILHVPIEEPIRAGDNDLGDLMLGGPTWVSGTALDPDGLPAPGAYGVVQLAGEGPDRSPLDVPGLGSLQWHADADGRFELRGDLPPLRYQLAGWCEDEPSWKLPPINFENGARDLELRFQGRPGARGRILADPEIPLQELQVLLRAADGRGTGVAPDAVSGEFRIVLRQAGLHDLEVRSSVQGILLASRPGLHLLEGQVSDVGTLDLRGLPRTRISALDPDGNAMEQGWLLLPGAGGPITPGFGRQKHRLPITLLHTTTESSLTLLAEGFLEQEIPLDGGEHVVRLQRGVPVTIELAGLPAPPEGASWIVRLARRGDDGRPSGIYVRQTVPAGSNRVELALSSAGTWLVWLGTAQGRNSSYFGGAFGQQEAAIEVRAGGADRSFRLEVDAGVVAREVGVR